MLLSTRKAKRGSNSEQPGRDKGRATSPHRVAVVGAGNVGATFSYALLFSGLVGELVLIDVDRDRVQGEAMDLNHAVPLSNPVRIWAGEYADCAAADVVVIAAGTGQRPGESRLDLVQRNAAIFRQIVPRVTEHNRNGILLVATNPVDVLSYVAWKESGLAAGRVIGSGTVLDTARFRYLLAQHLGVDARNLHAHIIGEHGDSEVPVWSMANVTGIGLETYCRRHGCELNAEQRRRLFDRTRDAAYEIIDRKGATYYAVATGLLRIVESVLRNQYSVLAVSNLVPGYYGIEDLYLSLPAVIGRAGVEQILHLPLDQEEVDRLRDSAAVLREVLDDLD